MTAPDPGGRDRESKDLAGRLAAECKTAAAATAGTWPDTAARLSRLQAALEARRDRDGE